MLTDKQKVTKRAWCKARRAAGICVQCGSQCGKGLCDACKIKARPYANASNRKRSAYRLNWQRKKAARDKATVFAHYGNLCVCCGEQTQEFLTIDHSERNGSKDPRCHYAKNRISGGHWYAVIIKLGFPTDLRLLCWNCNHAEHIYGVCPHRSQSVLNDVPVRSVGLPEVNITQDAQLGLL